MSSISVTKNSVTIKDLEIDNQETRNIVNDWEEETREANLISAINIGASVLRNRATSGQVDYVKNEFKDLLTELERRTGEWDDLITDTMEGSLDPEKEGKPINKLRTRILEEIGDIRRILLEEEGVDKEASRMKTQGTKFEQEIADDLMSWQKYPDSFEPVGEETVGKTRIKVGDVLATTEHGWTIVMEAKTGNKYGDRGDKSLDKEMDESMAFRKSKGAIAITTTEAMEGKKWQNSIFLDRGKNRFMVAVDWKNDDYTILRLAYMLLRERIMAENTTDNIPAQKRIDPKKILEITNDIIRDMSSAKKMKQILGNIEGKIDEVRVEIDTYQRKIKGRMSELNALV